MSNIATPTVSANSNNSINNNLLFSSNNFQANEQALLSLIQAGQPNNLSHHNTQSFFNNSSAQQSINASNAFASLVLNGNLLMNQNGQNQQQMIQNAAQGFVSSSSSSSSDYVNHLLARVEQSLEMVSQNLLRDLDGFLMIQQHELKLNIPFNSKKRSFNQFEQDQLEGVENNDQSDEQEFDGYDACNEGDHHNPPSFNQTLDNDCESVELQQLSDWIQIKKRKKNTSQGKKEILKEFLMLNKNNPYPSERQKELFMKELDYDKKQLNNWFINARKRYLRKKVAYTPPDIRNKNEFDSILENKVRQSMNQDEEQN